jgi:hypothetical protein
MRYTLANTIEKSLAEVAERFQDPEGVRHWMEDLQKIEPQSKYMTAFKEYVERYQN